MDRYNGNKLTDIGTPVLEYSVDHTGSKGAARTKVGQAGELESVIYLANNAEVILTPNLREEASLIDGIGGKVVHNVYSESVKGPYLPRYVVIMCDDYSGQDWLN